jgi:hypothetical protein
MTRQTVFGAVRIVGLLALAALAGCAATPSASRVPATGKAEASPSASRAASAGRAQPVVTRRASRCDPHELAVTYRPVGATSGAVSATLTLTSVSARPCRLAGYLTVQRLASSGAAVATRVVHAGSGSGVFPDPGPHTTSPWVLAVPHPPSWVGPITQSPPWAEDPWTHAGRRTFSESACRAVAAASSSRQGNPIERRPLTESAHAATASP